MLASEFEFGALFSASGLEVGEVLVLNTLPKGVIVVSAEETQDPLADDAPFPPDADFGVKEVNEDSAFVGVNPVNRFRIRFPEGSWGVRMTSERETVMVIRCPDGNYVRLQMTAPQGEWVTPPSQPWDDPMAWIRDELKGFGTFEIIDALTCIWHTHFGANVKLHLEGGEEHTPSPVVAALQDLARRRAEDETTYWDSWTFDHLVSAWQRLRREPLISGNVLDLGEQVFRVIPDRDLVVDRIRCQFELADGCFGGLTLIELPVGARGLLVNPPSGESGDEACYLAELPDGRYLLICAEAMAEAPVQVRGAVAANLLERMTYGDAGEVYDCSHLLAAVAKLDAPAQ